ncbi:MAG: hypothetical protein EOS85_32635 [Mesorhizobium sp.]|nr:MAG: hypothetical protein EOS85_32635 [Mesorhizobium sp.]
MTNLLHRQIHGRPPVPGVVRGIELIDSDGNIHRRFRRRGGLLPRHAHPDVLAALQRQLDTIAYAHTSFFTTEPAERLGDWLIEKRKVECCSVHGSTPVI